MGQQDFDPDRLLDVPEAAALLQVKPKTLYAWAAGGKVPHRRVGSLVRFHRAELLEWTAEQAQGAAERRETKRQRGRLRVVN
jgi:excisionase family DNA binding protein